MVLPRIYDSHIKGFLWNLSIHHSTWVYQIRLHKKMHLRTEMLHSLCVREERVSVLLTCAIEKLNLTCPFWLRIIITYTAVIQGANNRMDPPTQYASFITFFLRFLELFICQYVKINKTKLLSISFECSVVKLMLSRVQSGS